MILRLASLTLALLLVAPLSASAQETGRKQTNGNAPQGEGDDDLLNPGVLDRSAGSPQRGPDPRSTQTPTTPANTTGDDGIPEQVGDEPELEYTMGGPVKVPPPETKSAIDAEVAEIEQRAQQYAQEINRINTVARTDPRRAETETRAAIDASDRDFDRILDRARTSGASEEVDEIANAMGEDGRPPSGTAPGGRTGTGTGARTGSSTTPAGTPRVSPWDDPSWRANRERHLGSSASTYGDPYGMYGSNGYDPIGYPSSGTPESRMSWWQKLLLKSMEGVAEGVKGLSERRANELKRREEKLRKEYPEHRAYVEAETRARIERSAFARHGGGTNYDKRLDDLILGPARSGATGGSSTSSGSTASGGTTAGNTDFRTSGLNRPVARLPRLRDPVTNEERIVIDMPLGVDPVRPLR